LHQRGDDTYAFSTPSINPLKNRRWAKAMMPGVTAIT
jgi:hypothetical protein